MPFIAVELEVIEGKAAAVARASGEPEDRVLAGLVRLWHHCWRDTTDGVSKGQLAAFFGGSGLDGLTAAMVDLGFLDPTENGWRVRGAERYLRLKESRKRGAATTNAKRRSSDAPGRSKSDAERTLPDALAPSTEHRSKELLKEEEEEAPPAPVSRPAPKVAPKKPDDPLASAEAFFAFAQNERLEAGLALEPVPRNLSAWWSNALMETNGDAERVLEALKRFAQDPYWRKATPPLPFPAFMKQLPSYLPPVEARSA